MTNEERQHLENIRKSLQENLRTLEQQAARFGPFNEPVHIVSQINAIKAKLEEIEIQLSPAPAAAGSAPSGGTQLAEKLQDIGITDLWQAGGQSIDRWRALRSNARRTLDVMTISGVKWVEGEELVLRELLKRGCRIQVLLAQPNSQFVQLRERRESQARFKSQGISKEIEVTAGLLEEIAESADARSRGSLEIRYCQSDIPCRLEIIDRSIIHWTPHILPARAQFMPAFELNVNTVSAGHDQIAQNSTPELLLAFFDLLWDESAGPAPGK